MKNSWIIGIDEVGRAVSRRASPNKWIIGIDEVGRGSLAGPVTVAAVAVPIKLKIKNKISKIKLRDSKKLSSLQREAWFVRIKNHPQIKFAIAHVQPGVIDRINISNAANLAATRAVYKLTASVRGLVVSKIILDGGLYIKLKTKNKKLKIQTVIRADEKFPAVSLASIIAKVTRDKLMARKHKKFPQYNFLRHKGYGTKLHMAAVKRFGPSVIHRISFL